MLVSAISEFRRKDMPNGVIVAVLPQIPNFEGKLETCTSNEVRGWIWDRNSKEPIFVLVCVDEQPVCTVVACDFRMDLQRAGKREGQCGFRILIPEKYINRTVHQVRVSVLHSKPEYILGEQSVRSSPDATMPTGRLSPTLCYHSPRDSQTKAQVSTARALVGRERWLFLADDSNNVRDQISGRFQLSQQLIDQYRKVFAERRDRLARLGIPYVFFTAPTKELICETRMPPGIKVDRSTFPINIIREALIKDGFEIQMLEPHLLSAENEVRTFYRTDTHWNYTGSHVAYEAIIEHLDKIVNCGPPVRRDKFKSKIVKKWRGDLADKEKVAATGDGTEVVPFGTCAFVASEFEEDVEQLLDVSGDVRDMEVPAHLQISKTRKSLVKDHRRKDLPKAIFFRDSFTTLLAPMLAQNFSRSAFLWSPEMNFPVIEAEKPDIVVQIMVDRFSVRQPVNVG